MNAYEVWRCGKCFKEHGTREEAVDCCPPERQFICDKCGMFFEEFPDAENCHTDGFSIEDFPE